MDNVKADRTAIVGGEIGKVIIQGGSHDKPPRTDDKLAQASLGIGGGVVGGAVAVAGTRWYEASHPGSTRSDPTTASPPADRHRFFGQKSYAGAVRCQAFIIRQYTGADLLEELFADEARVGGGYRDDQGTRPGDVGQLLEKHGIPIRRYTDANPWQLATELGNGHRIIIGAEADELWHRNPILAELRHRLALGGVHDPVVVSGIDTSDPGHVRVAVIDPGLGKAAARYSIGQFLSAWKDGDFFMVATREPPPPDLHLPEMRHFDYEAGHVDHVGEMAWDDFQAAYDAHDDAVLSRLIDPYRHESHGRLATPFEGDMQDDDVLSRRIDPYYHEHQEHVVMRFDDDDHDLPSPLSNDLDDPYGDSFSADQEDDMFGDGDDGPGDDGGLDFG